MDHTSVMGLPYPSGGDAPNGPGALRDLAAAVELDVIMRFTSASDRDSKLDGAALADGMVCWVDSPGTYLRYRNGAWIPLVPGAESYTTNLSNGTVKTGTTVAATLTIPSRPWPRVARVEGRGRVASQQTVADTADLRILIGTGVGVELPPPSFYEQVSAVGSRGIATADVIIGADADTSIQLGFVKTAGTGAITLVGNGFYGGLTALVIPA